MAENKIAEALELLGLGVDEEFTTKTETGKTMLYRVNKDGTVQVFDTFIDKWVLSTHVSLAKLLNGEKTIKSKPWTPQKNDLYWYISATGGMTYTVWSGDARDLCNYAAGNCFETDKDAAKDKDKLMERLLFCYRNGRE